MTDSFKLDLYLIQFRNAVRSAADAEHDASILQGALLVKVRSLTQFSLINNSNVQVISVTCVKVHHSDNSIRYMCMCTVCHAVYQTLV